MVMAVHRDTSKGTDPHRSVLMLYYMQSQCRATVLQTETLSREILTTRLTLYQVVQSSV